MKLARISSLLVVLAAVLAAMSSTTANGSHQVQAAVARPTLSGGASSMDELLGKFLQAVSANDREGLERIRVTEEEYRRGILPWSVAPGQPLQTMSAEGDEFFWQVLNTKSAFHRQGILTEFAGRHYEVVGVVWEKGIHEWAGYRSYGRLRLTVRDESGQEELLQTGSVAEVDGRFKFISYIRD